TALAVSGNSLYAGGAFSSIGGQSRTNLAKLSTSGKDDADPNWNPEPSSDHSSNLRTISALVSDNDCIYVSGAFHTFYGGYAYYLDRLSTAGSGMTNTSWLPDPDGAVSALALDGHDLYVGGYFENIGEFKRNGLAKLSTTNSGTADPAWDPSNGRLPSVVYA